jgi:hypothetical protein
MYHLKKELFLQYDSRLLLQIAQGRFLIVIVGKVGIEG